MSISSNDNKGIENARTSANTDRRRSRVEKIATYAKEHFIYNPHELSALARLWFRCSQKYSDRYAKEALEQLNGQGEE